MLRMTGKCLGITNETVQGPTGSFVSTKIHVLDGYESRAVRVGRDFPTSSLPKEGDEIDLEVVVSAYAGRNGAAVQITALNVIKPGLRAASAG